MSIAMARTNEPHSADSQFYINLADNIALDPKATRWGYAVFGVVTEGIEVVDDIGHRAVTIQSDFQNVPSVPGHHRARRRRERRCRMMTILFVSDLHLDASRPEVTDCFIRFLRDAEGSADALYILGDLFEVWFGDDDPSQDHRDVAAALSRLVASGTPCYLVRGNRDFLIGRRYAAESGLTILGEQTVVDVGGDDVLLLHGDELCTDDPGYQRFRTIARSTIARPAFFPAAFERAALGSGPHPPEQHGNDEAGLNYRRKSANGRSDNA